MSEIFKAISKAGSTLGDLSEPAPTAVAPEEREVALGPRFELRHETVSKIRDHALRAILKPETVFAEQIKVIRAKVGTLAESAPFECFGIVSATEGEGKTTIAVGLAAGLAAERSRAVLLVEANLRSPVLARRLGLPAAEGLSEWLTGDIDSVPVSELQPFGFSLLRAGRVPKKPGDLLASERMKELLQLCRARYDRVVLDCTGLTPVADAVILQDLLDGFLLVVRSRYTSQDTVQRALTHLKRGTVKGVIFNAHRRILR